MDKKKEMNIISSLRTQGRGRTGTGVNLLVFETSASTDSATWAIDYHSIKKDLNKRSFKISIEL